MESHGVSFLERDQAGVESRDVGDVHEGNDCVVSSSLCVELNCSPGFDVQNRISSHDRSRTRTEVSEPRDGITDVNGCARIKDEAVPQLIRFANLLNLTSTEDRSESRRRRIQRG